LYRAIDTTAVKSIAATTKNAV